MNKEKQSQATKESNLSRARHLYEKLNAKEVLLPIELDALLLSIEVLSYFEDKPYSEYNKDKDEQRSEDLQTIFNEDWQFK
jgi:hypothetical protein